MKKSFFLIALFIVIITFSACEKKPPMPKPSTYLRLEVEKTTYKTFNEKGFPFSFSYPSNADIEILNSNNAKSKWLNLNFKKYDFVANLSFLTINNLTELNKSVNDCYLFLKRHEKLSGGIVEQQYFNRDKQVYGTIFNIKGRDVVSPMQLYLTDSNKYFVRIALNNNHVPNNDSAEVVITQIKKDLINIVNTFSWKNK